MPTRAYVIADVFTDRPLEGNPLAVFPDSLDLDAGLMQRIAREMNLSETVFIGPGDGEADATVRIFTPTAELPFAGHPILGAAYVLADGRGELSLRLRAPAGVIPVQMSGRGGEMRQPLPARVPTPDPDRALRALGITAPVLRPAAYSNGPTFVYVGLESPEEVARLRPDLNALGDLGEYGWSCFAALGGGEQVAELCTRMFAPALGVAEDPATGSAAGPLAVHLVRNRWVEPGARIRIHQGAEVGRPSLLLARAEGTREQATAVYVAGSAVIVARGEFHIP